MLRNNYFVSDLKKIAIPLSETYFKWMETPKKIRIARGKMTAAQAALAIGCPKSTYDQWESGRRKPPEWVAALVIERLAKIREATRGE